MAALISLGTASAAPAPLDPAKSAIASGDWERAAWELENLPSGTDVDPIEVRFLKGLVESRRGNWDNAIRMYRGILAGRPELHRVRLDLAYALFMIRDDEAARYHFEHVRAADIPDQVATNIDRFLAVIRRRRTWSADVAVGLAPDSNINGGSRNDTVMVAGLPFELSSEAKETSGVGVLISTNAERFLPIGDDWALKVRGSLIRRDFRKSQFDDMTLRTSVGALARRAWGEIELSPQVSVRSFGNETLTRSAGFTSELHWRFTSFQTADVTLEWSRNSYPDIDARNGYSTWLTVGQRIALDSVSSLSMGVERYRETCAEPVLSNTMLALQLGYQQEYGFGVTALWQLRLAETTYDGEDGLFGIRREDSYFLGSISVAKRNWRLWDFSPVLAFSFMRGRSTIPLYEHDRRQYLLGLQRQF